MKKLIILFLLIGGVAYGQGGTIIVTQQLKPNYAGALLDTTLSKVQTIISPNTMGYAQTVETPTTYTYAGDTSLMPTPNLAGDMFINTLTKNLYLATSAERGGWQLYKPSYSDTIQVAYLGADITNSTTSYANVIGLSFSLLANKDYYFEFNVIFQTAITTTGIGIAVNGPASPTSIIYRTDINTTATASTVGFQIVYDGTVATTGVATQNSNYPGKIWGIIRNGSTAGTLILRFKSEVNASQVTIKQGSIGQIRRLN